MKKKLQGIHYLAKSLLLLTSISLLLVGCGETENQTKIDSNQSNESATVNTDAAENNTETTVPNDKVDSSTDEAATFDDQANDNSSTDDAVTNLVGTMGPTDDIINADWQDALIQIDGLVFTIPHDDNETEQMVTMSYPELMNLLTQSPTYSITTFSLAEDVPLNDEALVDPHCIRNVYVFRNNMLHWMFSVTNDDDNVKAIKDCYVSHLIIPEFDDGPRYTQYQYKTSSGSECTNVYGMLDLADIYIAGGIAVDGTNMDTGVMQTIIDDVKANYDYDIPEKNEEQTVNYILNMMDDDFADGCGKDIKYEFLRDKNNGCFRTIFVISGATGYDGGVTITD